MNSAAWSQISAAWGAAIWNASWQGAVGIAVVYLICRVVPRLSPAIQCWMWRLAYLKLFVSLFWSAALHLPKSAPKVLVAISGPAYDMLSDMSGAGPSSVLGPTLRPAALFGIGVFILWIAGCIWCIWRVFCE